MVQLIAYKYYTSDMIISNTQKETAASMLKMREREEDQTWVYQI